MINIQQKFRLSISTLGQNEHPNVIEPYHSIPNERLSIPSHTHTNHTHTYKDINSLDHVLKRSTGRKQRCR